MNISEISSGNLKYTFSYCGVSIFSTHFRIIALFAFYSQKVKCYPSSPKKTFQVSRNCEQRPIDLITNTTTTTDILPERMNHVDLNNTLDPKTTIFSPAAVSENNQI